MNGTEAQALELQRQVAALCEHGLPAEMEKVLNLYDNEDIIIDYLRVDVNGLSTGNLGEAFIASVATQLKAVLDSRALPKRSTDPATAQDGNLIVYKRDAQGLRESRVELVFFHFLRTGVLQWWASPDQVKSWETAVLNLLSASPVTARQLSTLLYQFPAARQRFLLQFPHHWQQEVLALLDPPLYARTLTVRRLLLALSAAHFAEREPSFFQWQLNSVVQTNSPLTQLLADALVQLDYVRLPEMRILPLPTLLKHVRSVTHSAGENAGSDPESDIAIARAIYGTLQQTSAPVPENGPEAATSYTTGEDEPYYVHNAGLILLMPYLPQFLRVCEAADGNGITHEGYAAALLEYLATGRAGVGEHEMVFNKILCGIPPARPIEKITTLRPTHVDEADQLLQAVIANWPVLKNTSPDGLRASFLERPGKLSARDDDGNWLLQVECKSYDEWLLGELPWGYQVTGIPYGKTKKLIWTEWL